MISGTMPKHSAPVLALGRREKPELSLPTLAPSRKRSLSATGQQADCEVLPLTARPARSDSQSSTATPTDMRLDGDADGKPVAMPASAQAPEPSGAARVDGGDPAAGPRLKKPKHQAKPAAGSVPALLYPRDRNMAQPGGSSGRGEDGMAGVAAGLSQGRSPPEDEPENDDMAGQSSGDDSTHSPPHEAANESDMSD